LIGNPIDGVPAQIEAAGRFADFAQNARATRRSVGPAILS